MTLYHLIFETFRNTEEHSITVEAANQIDALKEAQKTYPVKEYVISEIKELGEITNESKN